MAIDTNIGPYYDDFDEFKNYHQLLFKPGYAVQARELTQIQSILRNQIAKFGNHIFKHGSVVIPGNTFAELNVPCIKLNETALSGAGIVITLFAGKTIVGAASGVKAVVKKTVEKTTTNPYTLYLSYVAGGGSNGKIEFDIGEEVYVEDTPTTRATVNALSAGSLAYVNAGVYYINGTFASVEKQSVVIEAYDTTPSARVMLKITEEIITSNDDDTLLDPSQGSYNFAAPGADRLKIGLTLVSLPLATTPSDDYVELMRYNEGVLEVHSRYPKYSELEKSLARRTYDESGDYIVSGFETLIREHKRSGSNNGVFAAGDNSKLVYEVSAGRGYIGGFEVESLVPTRIVADKARTSAHIKQDKITQVSSYGQYIMITAPKGSFDVENKVAIDLYDISAPTGGSKIGTANILALDLHAGDGVSSTSIYKAYVYNIKLTSKSIEDVGSIRVDSANWAKVVSEYNVQLTSGTFAASDIVTFNTDVRVGTVAYFSPETYKLFLHKHDATKQLPINGDTISVSSTGAAIITDKRVLQSVGQNSMIFKLPQTATAALKTSGLLYDLEHTVYKKLTIAAGQTLSGTVSSGTIVPLESGNIIATNEDGMIPFSCFSLNGPTQIGITSAGTGISGTGPYTATKTIHLYVQVRKTAATPRTKTLQTHTMSGVTAASTVTLAHTDVTVIDSIVSGGIDVTNRYELVTGQTDYSYEISSLKLKYGYSVPGGTLTIAYKYFSHGPGDFFSVDSYAGLGADYLDLIKNYVSPIDGKVYVLRDCIDYRSGTNSIVNDSIVSTSIQRYMPRTDLIVLDKSGTISVITGTPNNNGTRPSVSSEYHVLNSVYIPAYTYRLTDIINDRTATNRSTMKDIKNIDSRITRLEEYTTLTAMESASVQTDVIDAKTGLNRFKTGYLTENMTNPLEIADYFNSAFAASWNNFGLIGQLSTVTTNLSLKYPTSPTTLYTNPDGSKAVVSTADGYAIHNGGVITIAYTEEVFAAQPLSSRTTNINPFLVIAWNGSLKLYPNGDMWVEQVDRPEIFNNVDITNTQTNISTIIEPCPPPPPVPAPFVAGPVTVGPAPLPETPPSVFVGVGGSDYSPPAAPVVVPSMQDMESYIFIHGWGGSSKSREQLAFDYWYEATGGNYAAIDAAWGFSPGSTQAVFGEPPGRGAMW